MLNSITKEHDIYPDSYEEFKPWFESFAKRNGGWVPNNLERWYNAVESRHKAIRQIIGGVRRQRIFDLKSEQGPISEEAAAPYVKEILEVVPDYLAGYNFQKSVFLKPTITQGTHSAFKVGKHVKTYAERYLADRHTDWRSRLARLDKPLSKLGELWARARTKEVQLEATLSTSPKSFVLLGHYGPDEDSCFRQGSDKTQHKYVLGQSENTFTISIAQKHKTKDKLVNVARAFGFTTDNHTVWNFSNYYALPGFSEGDGVEVLNRMVADILGKAVVLHEDKCRIDPDGDGTRVGVFHNPYGRWTFAPVSHVVGVPTLTTDRRLIQLFDCPRCGDRFKGDIGWHEVDGVYVCKNCVYGANTCELSGIKTFTELVEAIDNNGFEVMACREHVRNMHRCDICKLPHEACIETKNNKAICLSCFELHFDECDICHEIAENHEISDTGDVAICKSCKRKGHPPFDEEDFNDWLNDVGLEMTSQ